MLYSKHCKSIFPGPLKTNVQQNISHKIKTILDQVKFNLFLKEVKVKQK